METWNVGGYKFCCFTAHGYDKREVEWGQAKGVGLTLSKANESKRSSFYSLWPTLIC